MVAISAGESTAHIADCTTFSRLSWIKCTFKRNVGNYLQNYLSLHHSDALLIRLSLQFYSHRYNHKYPLHGMDYQIIFKLQISMIYFCTASMQQTCGIKRICHVIFTVQSACLLINTMCFGRTIVTWVLIRTSI